MRAFQVIATVTTNMVAEAPRPPCYSTIRVAKLPLGSMYRNLDGHWSRCLEWVNSLEVTKVVRFVSVCRHALSLVLGSLGSASGILFVLGHILFCFHDDTGLLSCAPGEGMPVSAVSCWTLYRVAAEAVERGGKGKGTQLALLKFFRDFRCVQIVVSPFD